jgi:hypothetical protein
MTFPDRGFERPVEPSEIPPENTQNVIPPSQRSQDPERDTQELVTEHARPLTDQERKAADRDAGATATTATAEPSYTRVGTTTTESPAGTAPISGDWQQPSRWLPSSPPGRMLPMGIGWMMFVVCSGVGIWLFLRWRRERNKPINRLRRQARQAAAQAGQTAAALRERMSDLEIPEDAGRPAIGLGAALMSGVLLWWQQSQARGSATPDMKKEARRGADKMSRQMDKASRPADKASRHMTSKLTRQAQAMSDIDWQQRLMELKERWTPGRVELEKVSISKR